MAATHKRVLVSNRGEGNWVNPNNEITADSIFFPHGATKDVAPAESGNLANAFDFSGWETKSNWLVQAQITSGTACSISVFAMRPSGVEELVVAATAIALAGTASFTWGGNDAERIVGPVSYVRFVITLESGSPFVSCYVTGWNEGDLIS